jgi:branched-chain amino acid aminotransferase
MKRIWMDGGLVQGKIALSASDRGLTLGDGIFETIAVNRSTALWQLEHLDRFRAAAREMGIPFPETKINKAIDALTDRVPDHHVLRLTLTRGEGGRGLAEDPAKPIATLQPFDANLRFQPVSLATSTIRRNLHSPSSRLKTTSYIDNVLAAREAREAGADDALILNTAGRPSCATIGNLFLEMKGELVTPSLTEGILQGVTRAAVITVAKKAGLVVRERQVKVSDLARADGIFVTNSLRFLRSVTKLDDRRFPGQSKLVDKIVQGLLNAEKQQIVMTQE